MKNIIFLIAMVISFNCFATIYEKRDDGVMSFANVQNSGSTTVNGSYPPIWDT